MNPVPTLPTYDTALKANITANKFGYSLSEDINNMLCFRGILFSNINTLVTNQYNSSAEQTINWTQPAIIKNTTTPNTN
jgi:hypothetical protein